MTKIQL